jgi:hypothetical protein
MIKLFTIFLIILATNAFAGPPYDTDDPVPVSFHNWEVYFSSHLSSDFKQWNGTAPHLEVNYGVLPNVQLHFIAPMTYIAVTDGKTQYGYGDTELGAKIRLVKETRWCPEIGIFPLFELPSGNAGKGLGNGRTQVYLPIWLQKSFGKWITYGGAGYWINPGKGNRNWQFYGCMIQYQLLEKMSLGTELYHSTSSEVNSKGETRFNIGTVIDLNHTSHLLFSAGSSINGSTKFQCYIGYQLTFGRNPA